MDNVLNETVSNPVVAESDPTLAQTNVMPELEGDVNESQIALNLIQQAAMLEDDAKALLQDADAKKAEAYRLNPDLEPRKGPGRPKKVTVS